MDEGSLADESVCVSVGVGCAAGVEGLFLSRGAQVGGGDLEAVEEETGAARVDVLGGDADEEARRGIPGWRRSRWGVKREKVLRRARALVRADDRAAGVVVVVAELLVTQARAATTVVVGEDVVALVVVARLFVVDGGFVVHGYSPLFWCKVFQRCGLSLDFRVQSGLPDCRVKWRSPGGCRGLVFFLLLF